MLDKLDKFLIDRVFQPVVDLSQRKPRWWTLQMGILQTLLSLMSGVFYGWHWSVFAMFIAWSFLTVIVCINDWTCAHYGDSTNFRKFTITVFLISASIGFAVLYLSNAVSLKSVLAFLTITVPIAFNSFAACRPPKPPVRRTSSKLSTSGAA